MADLSYLLEKIDSESPGELSVAPGATEATLFFIIKFDDLYKFYVDILGYTAISTVNRVGPNRPVGLERQIPMSHPNYPWLYAQSVDLQGVSVNGSLVTENFGGAKFFNIDDPPNMVSLKVLRQMDIYDKYRVAVKFNSLPYLVARDLIKFIFLYSSLFDAIANM